jgi:hypothetical protein
MRNFSLNYKLVPRSPDEATNIENIIKTFKMGMLPYGNSDYRDPGGSVFGNALDSRSSSIIWRRNNSLAANLHKSSRCLPSIIYARWSIK